MPDTPRARHRGPRSRVPAVVASVVAVALVVLVIVLVNVLHGGSSAPAGGSPVVSVSALSPSSGPPSSSVPTPTSSAPPRSSSSRAPVRTTAPVATPAPGALGVEIFNNSSSSRRAAVAASRLRARGYPIVRVANKRYPGADVVYYPPGDASAAAAARALVARNLGITSAGPRPASVPSFNGLIVVVGSTFR